MFSTPSMCCTQRWAFIAIIYRDNLSAIVIGNSLLPIVVIAQNSFDLSINDVVFVIYVVIANKLSR